MWKKNPGILQRAVLRKWAVRDEGYDWCWRSESAFIQCEPPVIMHPPLFSSVSPHMLATPTTNTDGSSFMKHTCLVVWVCFPSVASIVSFYWIFLTLWFMLQAQYWIVSGGPLIGFSCLAKLSFVHSFTYFLTCLLPCLSSPCGSFMQANSGEPCFLHQLQSFVCHPTDFCWLLFKLQMVCLSDGIFVL